MKRTISKLLGLASLALIGLGSIAISTPAQAAAMWSNLGAVNGIVCQERSGGTYPEDGHVLYCGADNAKRDAVLTTITTTFTNFPVIKTKNQTNGVTFFVFPDAVQFAVYTSSVFPVPDAQKQAVYNKFLNLRGLSVDGALAGGPYSSVVVEKIADGPYPHTTALPTGEIQHAMLHEIGHQMDYGPAYQSTSAPFISLGNADQNYLTATAISPTAAQLRSTHGYFIVASPPANPAWTEIFAEEVAKLANEATPSIGTLLAVDTEALTPYFKCTTVFTKAAITSGSAPTKANFDAVSASLYGRCVAPVVPVGCTMTQSSGSYPYQYNGTEPTIGWFVYCGAETDGRFKTRTGNNFQSLPTSIPPEWRPKFQAAGWGLYVFRDVAQAVTMLGSAAVPASAQVAGVLGFTQPAILGNAKTPFVAMFEQVKQTNGSYVEHPNTNDLFNYDSGLWRESGRVIDQLAGSAGSSSTAYQNRITGDISRFNLRDGCAASGPDSTLWGSLQSTICNTTTHVKKAPYVGVSNLAIVRGLTVAQLGSGAVKFPPDYQAMFADTPTATTYSLTFAEIIGYKRAAGNQGNDFAAMDAWVNKIYVCGKAYAADGYYVTAVAPTAACP